MRIISRLLKVGLGKENWSVGISWGVDFFGFLLAHRTRGRRRCPPRLGRGALQAGVFFDFFRRETSRDKSVLVSDL